MQVKKIVQLFYIDNITTEPTTKSSIPTYIHDLVPGDYYYISHKTMILLD